MTDISYKTHIRPFSSSFERITFTDAQIKKATQWALEMEEQKLKERSWQRDSGSMIKRLVTGILGELALEQYLGMEFVDWSIGKTVDYEKPDLSALGVDIGVKSVEFSELPNSIDRFPIILKQNTYPQAFTFYKPLQKTVFICGLATTDVLNTYQTAALVLSPALRAKGNKTAFYGFEQLLPPSSISEYIQQSKK